jgi:hypothetical protein
METECLHTGHDIPYDVSLHPVERTWYFKQKANMAEALRTSDTLEGNIYSTSMLYKKIAKKHILK